MEVRVADRAVAISAPQLRRLLCLLLLSPRRPVPHSRLVSSLWPDDEGMPGDRAPSDPAATLRVYASRLRRLLPAGAGPHLEAQGYRLDVDDDDLDAERFESLMAAPGPDPGAVVSALETALALWQGAALAEFRDEPWAVGAAVRLDELRLVALERLADARLALGQHRTLCGELERLVEDHPLRERFWAQLMIALYRSGRQAEALRAYQRLRDRLIGELGIEPTRELAELEVAVLNQDPSLSFTEGTAPASPAMAASSPAAAEPSAGAAGTRPLGGDGRCRGFVGRSQEIGALEEVLDSGQGPRLVAVTGEAGIGKTRLVAELCRRAELSGWRVVTGGCADEMPRLPYLPFVEALGAVIGASTLDELEARMGPAAEELAHLFPQLGRRRALDGDPSEAKTRLFEACVLLLADAAGAGLVLVLEDFHWADGASVELLEHCRRRTAGLGLRIVIVVTYRDRELDDLHPLPVATERWRRDRSTLTLAVGPLRRDDVAAMARELLSSEHVDAALVDQLHARSDGSPFLVEELLQASALSGARARPISLEVPANVVELIARRVSRLAPEEVAVVEAAAVLSGRESAGEITVVADCSEQTAHDALRRAARASLVEAVPGSHGGNWRFQHDLIRDAVYEHLSPPRRTTLHSRAADVLERLGAPAGDVARHLDAAGRAAEAGRAWERAGGDALAGLAFADAASAFGRAAERAGDPVSTGRLRCAAGEALHAAGDPAAAVPCLIDGLAMLEAEGRSSEAARYRLVLGRCHWERAEPSQARQQYETALATLEPAGASPELATAYVRLAGLLVADRDGPAAQRHAERAVEIATLCQAAIVRADAYNYLGCALAIQGNLTDGIGWMDRSWVEAEAAGAESVAAHALLNAATDRLLDLRAREVPAVADHLDRLAAFPRREFMSSYLRGDAAAFLGRLEQAAACYELAIAAARRLGTTVYESWASDGLALVLSELGRLGEASALLERQFEGIEPQDAVGWATARIRYHLACGDAALAADVARTASRTGSPLHSLLAASVTEALLAAGDLAGVEAAAVAAAGGEGEGDGDSGGDAAGRDDGEPVDPWLRLARARAELARGDSASAARLASAAASTFSGAGYQLEEARSRLVAARAFSGAGDLASGMSELDRAGSIADATSSAALRHEVSLLTAAEDAGRP